MARDDQDLERSYLGDAASRLARLFQLGGPLTPLFRRREYIQPVVVVGDGTTPGMGENRQRHFGVCGTILAGGTVNHFLTSQDVVIERVRFDHEVFAVATQLLVSYKGPNDAVGAEVPGGTLTGGMLDRAGQSEPAPLTQLVGGTAGARWMRGNLQAATSVFEFDGEFFLERRSRIIVVPTGAGSTINYSIFGRTF